MRRINTRLAIACVCAVATAFFTGAALAGNGKESAPGQAKKDDVAAAATQTAVQTDASAQSSDQVAESIRGQSAEAQAAAPGQVEQADTTATSTQAGSRTASNGELQQRGEASATVAGMKPTSSTNAQHWTTCDPTGGTSSSATCPSTVGNVDAAAKSDASKRYGNMQTAAEIVVSRGGTGVKLTGPGNSQPHKVSLCGKPGNPSGGVDVHAVKNYSSTACTPTQTQQVVTSSVCGSTSVTTITTTSQTAFHGNGKHLGTGVIGRQVTSTSTSTSSSPVVTPTGEVCSNGGGGGLQGGGSVQSSVKPAAVVAPAATPSTPAAGAAPTSAGSVLGAKASLAKSSAPASSKAEHGVLGTVARVSGTTLPFTGFPLWVALVAALALIGTGLALRRRGSALGVR